MTDITDNVIARLYFEGEDGTQFVRGVTSLGDVPVVIRFQLGRVTDCGTCLMGEGGQKMVGFNVLGDPYTIYQLVPSQTVDIWKELTRMVNSFESVEQYNVLPMKPGVH